MKMTYTKKKNNKLKMTMRDRPNSLLTKLDYLIIALILGSCCLFTVAHAAGSSVVDTDFKKLPRTSSRGFNDVVDGPNPPDLNYEEYDDEYSQEEVEMDHNIDSVDRHYLDSREDHSEEPQAPEIAKCCAIGEAFNAEGRCHVLDKNSKHDRTLWYPHQMYSVETGVFVPVNLSTWNVVSAKKIECEVNESAEIISDLGEFVMLADGGLFLSHHHRHIDALDFCFDQQIGKAAGRAVQACFTKEELGASAHSLRKCCPTTTVVKPNANGTLVCFPHENPTPLPGNWTVIHGEPRCLHGKYVTEVGADEMLKVDKDGTLTMSTVEAPYLNYCLDYFLHESDPSEVPKMKIMICLGPEGANSSRRDPCQSSELIRMPAGLSTVYGIALIVSSVCLALAAIISLRLPELRSLHGKCQLSHLATLFCFFVLLAATHLGADRIPVGLCTFFAVAIHFCALSSFLWLNLLCVNIYLTFRSLRPPLAARRGETRRLFFLCVYAWGIPAAFCLFLYTLDTRPGTLDPMPPPSYGKCKCGISSREAEFAYLFGPVGLLLLCNGILFCLTAQELLCGLWRLDNSDSINFRRKSMGIVVAKLGIVMGMGWIFDVSSWSAGPAYPYFFYAADIFNSLQGLFIFVVLIWRKRVLEVLHIRKPSIIKDETLTNRPFLHKNSTLSHTITNGNDQDTSLISAQDA